MKANGIITRQSRATVKKTIDYLVEFLSNHGATVYARIDQQAEAQKAGIILPPLEYLLFGNPAKGALVIQENILSAIDLPLKVIAWSDAEGQTWVAFNQASYLNERFGLREHKDSPLDLNPMVDYLLKNQIQKD